MHEHDATGPARSGRLATDDRGAIMVIGIFMCTFLVGALWYIAGIGDVLIYHERLQEGADAVAFSAATIEARGMNIIVLINLIMAAILAIRVAINVVKYALILAGGIFTALSFIPFVGAVFAAAASASFSGAEAMQDLDNSTRTAIDDALIALHGTWEVVEYSTPAAAFAGAEEHAGKYGPIVVTPSLIFGATVGTSGSAPGGTSSGGIGLPVEDGSLSRLCEGAFTADKELLQAAMPGVIGDIGGAAMSTIGSLAEGIGAGDLFCELGGGSANPDLSQLTSAASSSTCQSQRQQPCDAASAANTKLQTDSGTCGYSPGDTPATPETPCQMQVDADNSDYQNKNGTCHQFDNCESNASNGQGGGQSAAQAKVNGKGKSGGSEGDKFPAKVQKDWHDGIDAAQIVSVVFSTEGGSGFVNTAPKFERIASRYQKQTVKYESPGSILGAGPADPSMNAIAQAEFFYDCQGDWKGCNSDENAMWNFHWRARFRLVNTSASSAGTYLEAVGGRPQAQDHRRPRQVRGQVGRPGGERHHGRRGGHRDRGVHGAAPRAPAHAALTRDDEPTPNPKRPESPER